MKRMALCLAAAVLAQAGFSKTVGVLRTARDVIKPGMLKTLEAEGWAITNISPADLANTNKLAATDVLLFTGGWNDYYFPSYNARRALHNYVAGGKGILSSGFRSGYSRTASRPLFPQVGATHNRGNGSLIEGFGDSPLARAIKEPFSAGGWDHMTLAVGPAGKAFAQCAGDPVGAHGEIYGGRYIALGAFIGGNAPSNGMTGVEKDVFRDDELAQRRAEQIDAEVAKRAPNRIWTSCGERTWDWTFDARGRMGRACSVRPKAAGVLEAASRLEPSPRSSTGRRAPSGT